MRDWRKPSDEFSAEAAEILDALGRDLLALDERRGHEPDPELVNAIFRGAHSLKGVAGLFGQERVAALAHAAEDLLDRLRLGKVEPSDEVLDALVDALDVLQALVAEAAAGQASPEAGERGDRAAARLQGLAGTRAADGVDPLDRLELSPDVRAVLTEYEEHRLRENVAKGLSLWRVRAAFDLSDFDKGLAILNAKLKPLGEVISTLPSSTPGEESSIAFDLIYGTRRPAAEVRAALEETPATLESLAVRPAEVAAAPAVVSVPVSASAPAPAPRRVALEVSKVAGAAPMRLEVEQSLRSPTQTVRVDIRRLDELMNAVGELIVIKGNLQRITEAARGGGPGGPGKLWGQELSRETRALERKLDSLQDGLLGARMVPLVQVFEKLARVVRRVARDSGKEIDFAVSGGEVELDKLIVEELSDPLMHIIRNAIDHGIESPEARMQQGKPRRGAVSLWATQRGNHVILEVTDDGAGIDEERVRDVALERGLLAPAEAEEISSRDLLSLIFAPGFSTARSVSELSGRGVGLDVVKTNIANLSGRIDVHTEPGKGTAFEITLPVTLAIIRALLVSVSGRLYALPLSTVVEILSVTQADVRTVERREMMSVRGRTVPLVRLARLFGHPDRAPARWFAAVTGLADDRVCLGIDELLGQQDIVVKPLGGRLARVRGIAGATDLGNRRTVLVLDVGALIEEAISPERHAEAS